MRIESIPTPDAPVVFRPYTGGGSDLREATDPINLLFVGEADALGIRAALRSLGPGRAERWESLADPGASWTDGVGGAQTAFAPDWGWSGGAVQLELGDFAGLRAHLRLFPFPEFVLGAAHLERLPAGRFEHTVFSWSGAERLVVRELERAGVVARRTSHEMRLAAPRRLSDAAVPDSLADAAGWGASGLLVGEPIPGWGSLSVVTLDGLPSGVTPRHLRWSRLTLDTQITLPAIAAQADLRVQGPVDIEHEVSTQVGRLRSRTRVTGSLKIEMGGRDVPAQIREWQLARVHAGVGRIRSSRRYLTGGAPLGSGTPTGEGGRRHMMRARVDRWEGPQVNVSTD